MQALEWRTLPGWFKSISNQVAITCSTHLSWEDTPVPGPGRLFQSVGLPQTASSFPHSPTLPLLADTLLLTPFNSDPFNYSIDTYRTLATFQTRVHRYIRWALPSVSGRMRQTQAGNCVVDGACVSVYILCMGV